MKDGQTWISAVLYIALGTVVLTIILAAGLPVLNKLKDKNTVVQTKEVMFQINNAVKTVASEGPGSQRTLFLNIGQGDLKIDEDFEKITWTMETTALLSEPNVEIREGSLIMITEETNVIGKYSITLSLDYLNIVDLALQGSGSVLNGRHNLVITNKGVNQASAYPQIVISET